MFKFLGGQSKKSYIEQARVIRADVASLKAIVDGMLEAGNTFTLLHGRNGMHVYPGDFTGGSAADSTGGPVLVLEYKSSHHCAYIKNGSGELLMMLVREKAEDAYFDQTRRYASFGAQTEGRLYLNGSPVGVNYSNTAMDVAPKVTSEERSQTGASLVELYKEKQGNSLRLYKRKGNGEKGTEVAAFSRVKQGSGSMCVFSLMVTDFVDPVVCLVMAWFAATVDMGHSVDPSQIDKAPISAAGLR